MVGRVDCLVQRTDIDALESQGHRSLRRSLQSADAEPRRAPLHAGAGSRPRRSARLQADRNDAAKRIENRTPVSLSMPIRNIHRTVGTMLSGEIARRYGSAGLPDDTIRVQFTGCAGQSFGAFLAKGVTLTLEGDGQRLRRQGTFRRQADHLPSAQVGVRARGKYSGRQRLPLRRDQRRSVLRRHGRRTVCGAQLRRDGRGRRRGRPRLRIHDQRPGRRAGHAPGAISPRA